VLPAWHGIAIVCLADKNAAANYFRPCSPFVRPVAACSLLAARERACTSRFFVADP